MSIRAAGKYLATPIISTLVAGAYYKHKITHRTLGQDEHCYHGTTDKLGPKDIMEDTARAVGKTFETNRPFYFTTEQDKHVSIRYAQQTACSLYRPGDMGNQGSGRGVLVKFRPVDDSSYESNFIGGAKFIPEGRTVVITGIEHVDPASEAEIEEARTALQD